MTSMDSRSSRLSMLCVLVAPCAFRKCTSARVRSTTWSKASLQRGKGSLSAPSFVSFLSFASFLFDA